MENEAIVDEILAAVEQLIQAAGPEWTLEFIQAGIEQAGQGGGEEQPMQPAQQQSAPPQAPPPLPGGTRIGRPQ
jgi:hypothetical protein